MNKLEERLSKTEEALALGPPLTALEYARWNIMSLVREDPGSAPPANGFAYGLPITFTEADWKWFEENRGSAVNTRKILHNRQSSRFK